MSQTHSAEKDEKEDTVSPLPHIKNNKEPTSISITTNDRQIIEPATTEESNPSKFNPPKSTILQSSISNSTPNLLSANFNPSHNPKKDELVQNASIKILEVESLLDKLSDHVDRHHRKSSQKLQDFEQIHSELSKIQSTLVDDGSNEHGKNKPSHIDPFIIIASTSDNDEKDDEKKDNGNRPKKIRNDTLTMLEPFQSLVDKIQKEIVDPNITSSDESGDDNKKEKEQLNKKLQMKRKSSIKMKKSELINIQEYVQEHRNKMKEKTYQYEEKKRQLKSAKERLNKAKARFKKRLNKSKQRSARNRAYSDNKKGKRPMLNMHAKSEVTTGYGAALSPKSKFRTINEHSDADTDLFADTNSLSIANLSKFNNGTARTSTQSEHGAPSTKHYVPLQNISAPIHLGSPKTSSASTPGSNRSNASNGYYNYNIIRQTHNKNNNTNSSVQSAFSTISDQSFVDDFHSIAAELESIDHLVRDQVSTPSMTSLLLNSPRRETSNGTSPSNKGGSKKQFSFKSDGKMSSYSESDSKETRKTMQSCSSIVASETDNSLQSEILHLHDIEQQISEI